MPLRRQPLSNALSCLQGADEQQLIIAAAHLDHALAKARPSVSATERQRLAMIYDKFRISRDTGVGQAASMNDKGKQKVTLA